MSVSQLLTAYRNALEFSRDSWDGAQWRCAASFAADVLGGADGAADSAVVP